MARKYTPRIPDPLHWGRVRDKGIRRSGDKQEYPSAVKVIYSRDFPKIEGTLYCAACRRGIIGPDAQGKCPYCHVTIRLHE